MENIYFVFIVILFALAVADLIVKNKSTSRKTKLFINPLLQTKGIVGASKQLVAAFEIEKTVIE